MFKKIVWLGFSTKWKNAKDIEKYIDSLVVAWADEFFTWYNPDYWYEKFGFEVSPNGRFAEHEQITDFETLKEVVKQVKKHNLEIFVNLNAWYYSKETMPLIKKMIEEFEEIWVDWIICWNIWILEYLKKIWYKWKINISTIFAVYNTEAIRFFLENYKINKVILSREITLKEIENIVTTFPETKFEVFWEWDFCRYNNWLCFAEHKYSSKDICTVVVNDLIIKKKFNPNFKEILLDTSLSNEEKVKKLDDKYLKAYEEIENILWKINLWFLDKEILEQDLLKIIQKNVNKIDLYFDALKPINSEKNIEIIVFLKWVKYLFENNVIKDEELKKQLFDLKNELENSIKTWIKFNLEMQKNLWWEPKLKAFELANFYSRWDNLNLYSYLFFSKFKNIETVKFPTRWRNYNEKLQAITEVVDSWKIDEEKYLNRGISIERAHYDLTYLFWDKLWFRRMIRDL